MVYPTPRRLAEYGAYKSTYGPKYHYATNFFGLGGKQLTRIAFQVAGFGAPLAIAAIFFTSGIPRVQKDVLMQIPVLGQLTKKPDVDPADNPF